MSCLEWGVGLIFLWGCRQDSGLGDPSRHVSDGLSLKEGKPTRSTGQGSRLQGRRERGMGMR